mgnify:FL=1|jgi:phosphatidylserine/phosphatidylglycerophosphate/cardiolipin synthase-like enzyme
MMLYLPQRIDVAAANRSRSGHAESELCMSRSSPRKKTTTKKKQAQMSPLKRLAMIGLVILVVLAINELDRRYGLGIFNENLPPTATMPSSSGTSSDWYEVYFTTPRYPDKPEYHQGSLDAKLVEFINTATSTIDVAAYDFDLKNVAQALADAAKRGVKVRMVTDTDIFTDDAPNIQEAFDILKKAKIPIVDDQRSAIMHNKFVIVDNRAVWTGSWNLSDGDTYRHNNHAIKIYSPQLAQNYTNEFEKMFVNRTFGASKAAGSPYPTLAISGSVIENYFAPKDKVADKVIARINRATKSIHFMAFSFTHDGIGQAVLERARAGVEVSGVFERTGSETAHSEMTMFKEAGLDVLQDGNPYMLHHKVFIIDGRTVVMGSFNFSENATSSNDENLLIIDNVALAQAFEEEYQRIYQLAQNPLNR